MLCREIIAVCSEIHTKHVDTLCGQNVELLNIKLLVTELYIEIQSYRAVNSVRLCYKNQSINAV